MVKGERIPGGLRMVKEIFHLRGGKKSRQGELGRIIKRTLFFQMEKFRPRERRRASLAARRGEPEISSKKRWEEDFRK